MTTPYGGVIILDQSGSYGTIRLQDGRVLPVVAHITQDKMTFTFLLDTFKLVYAIGTLSTVGTATTYAGTFVSPQSSDSGDWYGILFAFAE